jgi:prophage antirepressor-like protein
MNELTLFNFGDALVRVVTVDGVPWVVATDAAKILGYRDAANMVRMLDEDEKATHLVDTAGGEQTHTVISEGGLYTCILRSQKPEAVQFKRWVTHEVLPTIRKTGSYYMADAKPDAIRVRLDAHRLLMKLPDLLEKERHPEKRALLQTQITDLCRVLGFEPPDLSLIGCAGPVHEVSPVLEVFWETVDLLGLDRLNHAHAPDRIALNIVEVRREAEAAGLKLPSASSLRRALRLSVSPRFVDSSKAVNSAVLGRTIKCWVFEREAVEEV